MTMNFLFPLITASILWNFGISAVVESKGLADQALDELDQYNVIWTTPSQDSSGSMPLGNGDIGLNVWIEEDGDLLFYIGKTDAWSENVALLKLGRVRIHLSPNPFRKGSPFVQTLRLHQGEVMVHAGEAGSEIILTLWVDAHQPVIRLEASGQRDFQIQASLERWRTRERVVQGPETGGVGQPADGPQRVVFYPDTVLDSKGHRIVWFHRNEKSAWPENLRIQGLANFGKQSSDPLIHRTFGGAIEGDELVTESVTTLTSSEPKRRFTLSVYLLTQQTDSVEEWLRQLDQRIAQIKAKDIEPARQAHRKWWRDFWDRSWIRITGSEEARTVSQGYALQRFMIACGGRGEFPIKFNGGIFTVDSRERDVTHAKDFDADFRDWGGAYWFQNTRLLYWPMLASGDFDLMPPFFRMYQKALPLAEARTQVFFGHDGVFFPETLFFWGAYTLNDYGWDRTGKEPSYVSNSYVRYYCQGGLELAAMMLDYYTYTQDSLFAEAIFLPVASRVVRFYDRHYPKDDRGKVLFKPAAALETWHEAVNPLPEIAGLRVVLSGLLSLGTNLTSQEQRTDWQRLESQLPPLPSKPQNGQKVLLAADALMGPIMNSENPELYAVFPYRLYGIGRSDLPTGRLTFERRRFRGTGCWKQDAIQAAQLGLAHVARAYTVKNFSMGHRGSRFPGFWYLGSDWIPDLDNGGVAMMALQTMLLQSVNKTMFLFPAWPKEWNVTFKLHATYGTTVQGAYHRGTIEYLKVMPEARAKDLVRLEPQ
jgi:hypothetical protein